MAGKEEGVKDALDKISAEIAAAGGKVETVQKMERKAFCPRRGQKAQRRLLRERHFRRHAGDHRAVAAQIRAERGGFPRAVHRVAGTETREIIRQLNLHVMASFNKVILVGQSDARSRIALHAQGHGHRQNRPRPSTASGRSEAGEKKEEVTFVDVDVFGRTAENVGQYMSKGRPILIEGRLRWTSGTTSKPARRKASSASCSKRSISWQSQPRRRRRRRAAAPRPPVRPPRPRARAPNPSKATRPPESDDVPF